MSIIITPQILHGKNKLVFEMCSMDIIKFEQLNINMNVLNQIQHHYVCIIFRPWGIYVIQNDTSAENSATV